MQKSPICPICGSDAQYEYSSEDDVHSFSCSDRCGFFRVKGALTQFDSLTDKERRYLSVVNSNLNRYNCSRRYRDGGQSTLKDHKTVETIIEDYRLSKAKIAYAGGTEGTLYLVEEDGCRFSLRLYGPDYDRIQSELYWLESLNRVHIDVPEVVLTPNGDRILEVNEPTNTKRAYAVLYRWLEGYPFQHLPDEEKTPDIVARFGTFVGQMHEHGRRFDPPEWFVAPLQDIESIQQHIAMAEDDNATKVGEQLLPLIHALGNDLQGIIHNDLTGLNVLFCPDGFGVVDWGGFQWGYFTSDLAQLCLDGLTDSQYPPFFEGYRQVQPWSNVFTEHIELFKQARRFGLI